MSLIYTQHIQKRNELQNIAKSMLVFYYQHNNIAFEKNDINKKEQEFNYFFTTEQYQMYYGLKKFHIRNFLEFLDLDAYQAICHEYKNFKEWFKYNDCQFSEVKELIKKYNIYTNCDLKQRARHIYLYLNYLELGFNTSFAQQIHNNQNFFIKSQELPNGTIKYK